VPRAEETLSDNVSSFGVCWFRPLGLPGSPIGSAFSSFAICCAVFASTAAATLSTPSSARSMASIACALFLSSSEPHVADVELVAAVGAILDALLE
jgi:hypothetical protein